MGVVVFDCPVRLYGSSSKKKVKIWTCSTGQQLQHIRTIQWRLRRRYIRR